MAIKMIVYDLDGTLLRSDSTVSDYTLEILEECRKVGIKLAVATAQPMYSLFRFADILNPDVIIYNGGAIAKIGREMVYSADLDVDSANAIIKTLLDRGDASSISVTSILAEDDGTYYTNCIAANDFWVADLRHVGYKVVETDFSMALTHNVHKISARIDGSLGDLGKNLPNVGIIRYRDDTLVRFAHVDATKWQAIQACTAHLGIATSEIAAFGDDLIDVEMLKNCGIGVAVANAIPEVKAVADFVCESNDEDGVARWLATHVFEGGAFD